jgi:serine/threonine protein kinase
MVRKELKSVESAVYEDELRCLRILAKIKDPNIVELYGFYTYNYKHNFLFRKADDKDLDHFLRKKNRPKEFKSEETYYFAMCGLASGLKALHNHRNDELNLEMIGCHRDLKPNNILVDSGKFILADFGLSTIKKSTYSSKSMSRDRNDDYRAPESEDFQTGETFEVGRASDIWSLGAILAVVFAYMKSGPDGVKKFREKRKLKLLTYMNTPETMALFHGGLGKSNPGVVDWISEMQDGLSKAEKEWLDLVERMLRLTGRPDIDEVLWKLRFATLKKVCEPIEAVLSTTPHLEHSVPEIAEIAEIPHSIRQYLEFEIEAETFKTWLLKLDEYKIETEEALKKEETFSQLISTLRELKEYLGALENAEKNPYPVFSLFRLCNEQLLSPLSPSLQESIREDAELEVSKAARDDEQLQKLLQMLAKPGAKTRLLTLVTIKNMKDLTAAFGTTPPSGAGLAAPRKLARVDRELSANVKEVPTFRTGVLSKSLSPTARDVVVEELEYQGEWHDKSKELFDRMKNITRLPQQVSAPTFRALSCFGFYHDEGHHSFELVYEFPTGKSTSNSEVKQLNELFGLQLTHYNTPKGVVSLEDRFQLAHDLAATVFAFRKFGWLHKNISSYNVLFFVDTTRERNPEVPFKADLKNPYVIGFSHSRPDESTQISTKMRGKGKILYAYQHPSYGGIENPMARYVPEYDYYSLGLVLLEIGLWNSLEKMTPLHDSPPRKTIRDFIRDRRVPFLVGTMGETYQDAVEACLFGGLSTAGGDVDKNFQRMVVERLRACLPDKR